MNKLNLMSDIYIIGSCKYFTFSYHILLQTEMFSLPWSHLRNVVLQSLAEALIVSRPAAPVFDYVSAPGSRETLITLDIYVLC